VARVSVVVFFKVRDEKGAEKALYAAGNFELSRFEKYSSSPQEGAYLQFGNAPVSAILRIIKVTPRGKNMIVETIPREEYTEDDSSYPFLNPKWQHLFVNSLRILGFTVSG